MEVKLGPNCPGCGQLRTASSDRDRFEAALRKIENHQCGPFQAAEIARQALGSQADGGSEHG